MKKIKMAREITLTFEEYCNMYVVYVNVTKNRKPLIVPLNQTMVSILDEYLKYRHHKSNDDFLFCNSFGQQLVKSTCYHMLYEYNKRRGVKTTGIHRYRHTRIVRI